MSSHQEPSGYNSNEQPQQDLPPGVPQTAVSWGYQQGNINAQPQSALQYPQNVTFGNQEPHQQYMQAQPQQQYYPNQQPYYVNQAPYYPIHQWNQPIQQQNYPSQQQNYPSQQPYSYPPQDVQPFAQQQYYQGPSQHQASYQPQEQTWYQPQHPQHYQTNNPVQVPIVETVTISTQTDITLSSFGDDQTEVVQEDDSVQVPIVELATASTQTDVTLLPTFGDNEAEVVREIRRQESLLFSELSLKKQSIKEQSVRPIMKPEIHSNEEQRNSKKVPTGGKNQVTDKPTLEAKEAPTVGNSQELLTENPTPGADEAPTVGQSHELPTDKPTPGADEAPTVGESRELLTENPTPGADEAPTVGESQELLTENPTQGADEGPTVGKSQELPTDKPTPEAKKAPTVGESHELLTENPTPGAEEEPTVLKEGSVEWMGCNPHDQINEFSFEFDVSIGRPETVSENTCDLDQSLDFVFEYTSPSVQKNDQEKTESEVPQDSPSELASNECEEKVSHHSTGEPNKGSQDVIPLPNDSPVVETLTQSASPQPLTRSFADAAGSTQRFHSKETVSFSRQEVTDNVSSSLKEKPEHLKKQGQLKTTAKAPIPTEKVQSQSVAVLSEKKDTVERSITKGQLNVDSEGWTIVGKMPSATTELPQPPQHPKQPVKTIKPSTRQADVKKEVAEVENEKTEVVPSEASPIKKKINKKKQRKAEKEARNRAIEAENDIVLSQAYAQTSTHRTAKDTVRKTLQDFVGRQESVRVTLESSSPRSRTLDVPWFERDSILYAKRHEKPRNAADLVRTFLAARLTFWKENNSVVKRVKDLQVMRYELLSECQCDVIEEDVLYLKELFNAFPLYTEFFESQFLQMVFETERVSENTIPSIPIVRSAENDQVMSQEETDVLSQYLERHAQRRYATGLSEFKPQGLELTIIIDFKYNPWDSFSMIDASSYFRARSAAYANVAEPTPEHLQLSRLHNILASVPSPVLGWDAFFMTQAEKIPGEHSAQVYRFHLDVDYFKISFNYE